jgi:hypothetical protein
LVVRDANGATKDFFIKIADEVQNPDGLILDLSGSALDAQLDYNFSMDASVKSESLTCVKCVNKDVTYKDTCAYCEVTVTGTEGADGSLIIFYEE